MAQNSDILREPSMDELLASIREIIEENSESQQQPTQSRGGNSSSVTSEKKEPTMQQRNRTYDAAPQATKPDLQNSHPVGAQASGVPLRPVQTGGNVSYKNGRANLSHSNSVSGGQIASTSSPDTSSTREASSMQDSMNALAERIGLRRNDSAPQSQDQSNSAPAADSHNQQAPNNYNDVHHGFSPSQGAVQRKMNQSGNNQQPNIAQHSMAQAVNTGQPTNANMQINRYAPINNGNASHNTQNTGTVSRDNMSAQQENLRQNNMRQNENKPQPVQQTANQGNLRTENSVQDHPQQEIDQEQEAQIRYADIAGLDRNLTADVEHSTENMLRPLIAQWLDEHFRGLFEKVLREEVQRYIHKAMNRN